MFRRRARRSPFPPADYEIRLRLLYAENARAAVPVFSLLFDSTAGTVRNPPTGKEESR